uniref:Uncharacterized protein n=1 Tax=Arundo donax TaxID=35708 RepID=A0A0A9B2H6_ARUDO
MFCLFLPAAFKFQQLLRSPTIDRNFFSQRQHHTTRPRIQES